MKGIIMVYFDDGGKLAFTVEAFEELKEKGLTGVKYYEHWMDKTEAKKRYKWLA